MATANARRDYCTKPYKDGKYYSDCSSSVSYAYKEAGEGFGILNTVGMWNSKKLVDVPVTIKNGVIQNPEVLRIGDMLLFAGNDVGRKSAGYVGHVEMVGEISGGTVQLYGHGSGLAKKHEMNAYCRSRYNTKSVTPLKRRLLIRVRRSGRPGLRGGDRRDGERAQRTGHRLQEAGDREKGRPAGVRRGGAPGERHRLVPDRVPGAGRGRADQCLDIGQIREAGDCEVKTC